jgi:hypothetical protein
LSNHATPDELADQLGETTEDVFDQCQRLGVPIVHGRIDRTFFLSAREQEKIQRPQLPGSDLQVNFGAPEPGSSVPMSSSKRDEYNQRIRNAAGNQGGREASHLFIK